MILIDSRRLKFLQAGREITITTSSARDYHKGRTYAAGVRHNHTVLRVYVVKAVPTDDGLELTIRASLEDEVRLLGKNGGYVTNPAQALREEPEAVDRATEKRLVALGTLTWAQARAVKQAELDARALHHRLGEIEAAHARGEFDASRQLAAIRRRIEALEAKRRAA